MQIQVSVVILPAAGDDHYRCPQILQRPDSGVGGPAAAQHQNLFPGDGNPTVVDQGGEAIIVGVMTKQTAVFPADDGIHRTHLFSGGGELIQERNHIFLIRYGHIQTGVGSVSDKVLQFLRLFFKNPVFIASQFPVNLGGVTVPQLSSQ